MQRDLKCTFLESATPKWAPVCPSMPQYAPTSSQRFISDQNPHSATTHSFIEISAPTLSNPLNIPLPTLPSPFLRIAQQPAGILPTSRHPGCRKTHLSYKWQQGILQSPVEVPGLRPQLVDISHLFSLLMRPQMSHEGVFPWKTTRKPSPWSITIGMMTIIPSLGCRVWVFGSDMAFQISIERKS